MESKSEEPQHPKRQRCTKRVIYQEVSDNNIERASSIDSIANEQELLYSNTVSRLWNVRAPAANDAEREVKEVTQADNSNVKSDNIPKLISQEFQCSSGNIERRRSLRLCKNTDIVKDSDQPLSIDDNDESLLVGDEPMPPPAPNQRLPVLQSKKRIKKSVKSAIKKLQKVQKSVERSTVGSKEDDDDIDCVHIIEPISSQQSAVIPQHKITVKIHCLKSGLHKYDMLSSDHFSEVFKYISCAESVLPDCVSLYLREKRIQAYETPQSVGLTIADILECYIRSSSSSESQTHKEVMSHTVSHINSIQLLVQSDSKSKTPVNIGKDQPMGKLMQEFCRAQRVPLSQVLFRLDGETIDPLSTPNSLDLATGYCIDAVILTNID